MKEEEKKKQVELNDEERNDVAGGLAPLNTHYK